jgi:HK97 family phage major capsid protein
VSNIQDLYDKRANVFAQMEEIKARGFENAENRAAWDKAETDLDALTEQIAEAETDQKADKALAGYKAKQESERKSDDDSPKAKYARAFGEFLRNGLMDMAPEDRKLVQDGFRSDPALKNAIGVGTGSAGGYTVPQGFRDVLIETLKYYGPMLTEVDSLTTETGANLQWPTNDDTANTGAILSENTQVTQQDLTLGTASLNAYMYTSKLVLASLQFLQDARTTWSSGCRRRLAERLGRIFNAQFTTGTGTAQPQGIVTGATVGVTGTGSFAATGGVAYTNLVDTVESIDPAYADAPETLWMGHQTVRRALRRSSTRRAGRCGRRTCRPGPRRCCSATRSG